jgi:CO dehydrogenase/acetyl-CoA synthase alpha subunit
LTQLELSQRKELQWINASMRSSYGAFSQLVIKRGGPIVDGAIPGLVVLGSIREQAEQARGYKPVRNIPPWPLHQLLLPGLLVFQY